MTFELSFHGPKCYCNSVSGPVDSILEVTAEENQKWILFRWNLIYFLKTCIVRFKLERDRSKWNLFRLSDPIEEAISVWKGWISCFESCTCLQNLYLSCDLPRNDGFGKVESDLTKLITYVFPEKFCVYLGHGNDQIQKYQGHRRQWSLFRCKWDHEPEFCLYRSKPLRPSHRWRFSWFHEVPILLCPSDWTKIKIFPFDLRTVLVRNIQRPEIVDHLLKLLPFDVVNLIMTFASYKICTL